MPLDENVGNWYNIYKEGVYTPNIISVKNHVIRLNDGTILNCAYTNQCDTPLSDCWDFWIAFPKKGKMIFGKDIFYFTINSAKSVLPQQHDLSGNLKEKNITVWIALAKR